MPPTDANPLTPPASVAASGVNPSLAEEPAEVKPPDWIAPRIAAARRGNAAVTDGVANQLDALLRGPLAGDTINKAELTKIAKALLGEAARSENKETGAR